MPFMIFQNMIKHYIGANMGIFKVLKGISALNQCNNDCSRLFASVNQIHPKGIFDAWNKQGCTPQVCIPNSVNRGDLHDEDRR